MAKWMIPRHKPRGIPEWEMSDRNHGKKFTRKAKVKEARKAQRKRIEVGFLDLVTRQDNPEKAKIAKMQIGQCARKTKLTAEAARMLVRSASLEKGTAMFAYKCKWCGNYHLTSHPEKGEVYEIWCDGKKFRNIKEVKYGQDQLCVDEVRPLVGVADHQVREVSNESIERIGNQSRAVVV